MSIFPELLKYGVTGFAAILAILAFWLLVREIQRDSLRWLAVLAIVVFMIFSCALAMLTQIPPDKLADFLKPDPDKVCRGDRALIEQLQRQVERLSWVKIDGKLLGPPEPASVNVMAVRKWKIYSPGGDGRLKQKIYQDAAAIILMFWSGDYGESILLDEDQIKDGFYSLGEIRLKKGFDPHRLLADVENSRFALNPR
jgi:hypothetical protein